MSLRDAIADVCTDVINSLSVLRLRLLTSDGAKPLVIRHQSGAKLELNDGAKPLVIRHQSGAKLELKNDGKVYYNGTEIGTGSGSGVTNPLSENLDANGYTLSDTTGGLTLESSDGSFTFRKIT